MQLAMELPLAQIGRPLVVGDEFSLGHNLGPTVEMSSR